MPEGVLPDSIVVTATRVPISVRDAGQRISTWTAEDIANLSVNSFDELLRHVGGVEVFSRTGFGIQSDITMRGSTFNGVVVLIDGMPLNDAMTGHFITDMPLPLTQIKRVEVLRGLVCRGGGGRQCREESSDAILAVGGRGPDSMRGGCGRSCLGS